MSGDADLLIVNILTLHCKVKGGWVFRRGSVDSVVGLTDCRELCGYLNFAGGHTGRRRMVHLWKEGNIDRVLAERLSLELSPFFFSFKGRGVGGG